MQFAGARCVFPILVFSLLCTPVSAKREDRADPFLGILRDDQELHAGRLKLWDEFNLCWLSLFQKQKDITQALLQSGERQAHPSMLTLDMLDKMGKELIRLCDKMEPHGLVDYQMGIWEEEILSGKPQKHASTQKILS